MIERETKLRAWGNSIGLVIPKEDVIKENLQVDQKVKVIITPVGAVKVKDIFGKLKLKKSTEDITKEVNREIDTKFF